MSGARTIEWIPTDPPCARLLDQTRLPHELIYVDCCDHHQVAEAIRAMKIRGAPAIGVAAAFGMALAASHSRASTREELLAELRAASDELGRTRPTAVNLAWALERMMHAAHSGAAHSGAAQSGAALASLRLLLVREALSICKEDIANNRKLGELGAEWLELNVRLETMRPLNVLTHCNAGALAVAGYGTALGVIRAAVERGRKLHVWVDETRPWLQGARLTAWELMQEQIPHTLIADSMAASFMRAGQVDVVLVGADRIARNGDVANKIGTYGLAVSANHHRIPFVVAAPISTFDFSLATGAEIPIEQRDPREVTELGGQRIAPIGVEAANPAFDVTPHELVSAIMTERGVLTPPFEPIPH